jgi:hypothetical protein
LHLWLFGDSHLHLDRVIDLVLVLQFRILSYHASEFQVGVAMCESDLSASNASTALKRHDTIFTDFV